MSERGFVEIEKHRYEELLAIENRVCVASELLVADKNMNMETLLRVIGTPSMNRIADEMKKEREEILAKFREGNNGD